MSTDWDAGAQEEDAKDDEPKEIQALLLGFGEDFGKAFYSQFPLVQKTDVLGFTPQLLAVDLR